ncbi:MAG: sulfatase-like hydrolase/transferase [Planctomycetaceae bacterium]|nr:sulfatase-like hydrolase/transferase [Planctomycetaceae bacterium]
MMMMFQSGSPLVRTLLSGLVAMTLIFVTADAADAADRPHIVLCMADDQGWGDMAYQGHPLLKTPIFDEMAATCLRLDRFYAGAPVCSPTRASVMTGRTPNRSGVFSWGHSLRPQEVTVAEALRQAGYTTAHFGKWHLGSVMPDSPLNPGANGFDRWISGANFFDVDPWLSDNGRARQYRGESSEIVVHEALTFAQENRDGDRPMLIVVWFGSPHSPHKGVSEDLALYADQPAKQKNFLAEITAMDRAMGQLRTGLRELGIADNTLLWYCSDNGAIPEGSTGGLRGKKGQIYEGGLRVPCLIEWPARIQSPRHSSLNAGTVDIYPTLVEIAGAAPDHQPVLDGQSLLPLFDHDVAQRDRPLGFWDAGIGGFSTPSDAIVELIAKHQADGTSVPADHAAHGKAPQPLEWNIPEGQFAGHAAWLDGAWKLHRIAPKKAGGEIRWELYNLHDDPTEQQDLSEAQPERLQSMQRGLIAWLTSVTGSLKGNDYVR